MNRDELKAEFCLLFWENLMGGAEKKVLSKKASAPLKDEDDKLGRKKSVSETENAHLK